MKDKSGKGIKISRRGVLPILGSAFLLPFLGFGKPVNQETEEYQTLLKADGTAVRVKKSVLDKAKVIEKDISNKSFLGWLNKDK